MRFHFLYILLGCVAASSVRAEPPTVLLLVGAGGNDEYAQTFARAAEHWQKAAAAGQARVTTLGLDPAETNPRAAFRSALQQAEKGESELWLVLLGHGTFDRREARFNLRGDDFTAEELASWLRPVERPLVVAACFSCSGAFLKPLATPGRVVLTATRSGAEENYSRLGQFLAETIGDPAADLDQDGQISLLEAWLTAAKRVKSFYEENGRLATEHSLLDDNGDGIGILADSFKGLRATRKTPGLPQPDGPRAQQIHLVPSQAEKALSPETRAARDELELRLATLREGKTTRPPEEYYAELEALLLELARLYEPAPRISE